MNAVPFDTLKMAHRLEEAGFPARQAAGASEALAEALVGADLATRGDMAVARSDVASLEARIEARFTGLEHRIEASEARLLGAMELLRRDMTIKLGSLMIIGMGVFFAAMRYLPPHP